MTRREYAYEVKGGTKQAQKIASGFAVAISALRAADAGYENYVKLCAIAGMPPASRDDLGLTKDALQVFLAWLSSGSSLRFTAPVPEQLEEFLAQVMREPPRKPG